ncbi:MAG: hypothetical protein WDO19_29440 [Bacteroidota bacterium]
MNAVLGLNKWLGDFLMKEPLGENDKIIYFKLKSNFNNYIQQKKQDVLIYAMRRKSFFKNPEMVFLKKNSMVLKNRDILLSFIRSRSNS